MCLVGVEKKSDSAQSIVSTNFALSLVVTFVRQPAMLCHCELKLFDVV